MRRNEFGPTKSNDFAENKMAMPSTIGAEAELTGQKGFPLRHDFTPNDFSSHVISPSEAVRAEIYVSPNVSLRCWLCFCNAGIRLGRG